MADKRPTTTVVETGSSGASVVLIAVIAIILAVVAYIFLTNDNRKTDAITGAAQSVGQAADTAGKAVQESKP